MNTACFSTADKAKGYVTCLVSEVSYIESQTKCSLSNSFKFTKTKSVLTFNV